MPGFGDALTLDELQAVMDYVRTFCGSAEWARGELNLPRPMVTEKAYPEDEAVFTSDAAVGGPGAWSAEVVHERRFGARGQLEFTVPFGVRNRSETGSDWTGGMGDVAVGLKRDMYHSSGSGTIFSLAGASLPFTVEAELWNQPIGYRWARNLAPYDSSGTERFVRHYEALSERSGRVLARAAAATGSP